MVQRDERVIFLDVDGTILDHHGQIAPSTRRAVRQARAAGHLVLLCTGRSVGDIPQSVLAIGFDGIVSGSGASATVRDANVLYRPMSPGNARRVRDLLDVWNVSYFLQSASGIFAERGVSGILARIRTQLDGMHVADAMPAIRRIVEVDWLTIEKVIAFSHRRSMADDVIRELGSEYCVVLGSMPLPVGSQVEITEKGTSKGDAVREVLRYLDVAADRSIGIGDSWNDLEMFRVCGTSIAMGNADPALKRLTTAVTDPVDQDGVWKAFETLGLISP